MVLSTFQIARRRQLHLRHLHLRYGHLRHLQARRLQMRRRRRRRDDGHFRFASDMRRDLRVDLRLDERARTRARVTRRREVSGRSDAGMARSDRGGAAEKVG